MKWLALISASFLLLGNSQAVSTLPFYESFPTSYGDGTLLGAGSTANVWTIGNTGTSLGAVVTNTAALSHPTLAADAASHGLRIAGTPASTRNKGATFTSQTIEAGNPVIYASFLLKVEQPPSASRLFAALSSSPSGTGPSGVMGVWLDSAGRLLIGKNSSSTPAAATTDPLGDGTHLVVLRYAWNPGAGDDELALWLNPDFLGANESAVPDPTLTTSSGSDVAVLQSFWILHPTTTSVAATLFVDEIRVATRWAEATPSAAPPPSGQPLITQALITADGLILRGVSGVPNGVYQVLRSPNATLPMLQWTPIKTNTFDANGDFICTNAMNPAGVQAFYGLLVGGELPVPPSITTQPADATVNTGETVSFTVAAGGTAPLYYQWHFEGGAPLADATSALLTITNVQPGQAGAYTVVVSNSVGSVTSAAATLTVRPDPPGGSPAGFASMNGGTTGGAGGPVVTVNNFDDFDLHARREPGPRIIQVEGTINLGASNARVTANKTIVGLGTDALLVGNLKAFRESNIIVRNITFTNPGRVGDGDGLTLNEVERVWVDHCTFVDCGDGSLDITHASDWITVSWCKFYYTFNSGHNFASLVGHSDNNAAEDEGRLHVTFHHNWWSTLCIERMPRVRFGRVHSFNNYFHAPGNNYCIRVARDAEVLVENNYFENVKNVWERYTTVGTPGKLYATNNIQVNTTWSTGDSNSSAIPGTDILGPDLNPPLYGYAPDEPQMVPGLVITGAGAGKGPFAP